MEITKKSRYTEAQKRSAQKYLAKFAEIRIRVQPDDKQRYKAAADAAGQSLNKYIKTAIERQIEADMAS